METETHRNATKHSSSSTATSRTSAALQSVVRATREAAPRSPPALQVHVELGQPFLAPEELRSELAPVRKLPGWVRKLPDAVRELPGRLRKLSGQAGKFSQPQLNDPGNGDWKRCSLLHWPTWPNIHENFENAEASECRRHQPETKLKHVIRRRPCDPTPPAPPTPPHKQKNCRTKN